MTQEVTVSVVPVVVDVGKTKKKKVRQLKRGEGPLIEEVNAIIGEVKESLAEQIGDRQLLPVVLVYQKKKRKRRRGGLLPFPGLFGS